MSSTDASSPRPAGDFKPGDLRLPWQLRNRSESDPVILDADGVSIAVTVGRLLDVEPFIVAACNVCKDIPFDTLAAIGPGGLTVEDSEVLLLRARVKYRLSAQNAGEERGVTS